VVSTFTILTPMPAPPSSTSSTTRFCTGKRMVDRTGPTSPPHAVTRKGAQPGGVLARVPSLQRRIATSYPASRSPDVRGAAGHGSDARTGGGAPHPRTLHPAAEGRHERRAHVRGLAQVRASPTTNCPWKEVRADPLAFLEQATRRCGDLSVRGWGLVDGVPQPAEFVRQVLQSGRTGTRARDAGSG